MPGGASDNGQESNQHSVYFTWSNPGSCHKCLVLGGCISSGLSWNSHIDRIARNANRTLEYIRRNIKSKNQKVREITYIMLVRPQLEYAAPIWDPYTKGKHSSLKKFKEGPHMDEQ